MSAFYFARSHKLSFGASLLAACAFVLSAPSTSRAVGHWYYHNALAWLPLLLLLIRMGLEADVARHKMCFGLGAGIIAGFVVLSGIPHFMVVFAFTIACYWALYRLLHMIPIPAKPAAAEGGTQPEAALPGSASDRPTQRRGNTRRERRAERRAELSKAVRARPRLSIVRRVLKLHACVIAGDATMLATTALVGVLVALPLLLPAAEFAGFSNRAMNKSLELEHRDIGGPKWNVLQLLAIYSGDANYEGIKAAGAVVFLFTLFSIVRIRHRDFLLYAILFLALLDASLPKPFLVGGLVARLAPYKMGEPGRTMIAACLPLGLLAGIGLDAALKPLALARWRLLRSAVLLGLGAAVCSVLVVAAQPHPFIDVSSWIVILPALACAAAIVGGWLPAPRTWAVVIALLAAGETLVWNAKMVPYVVNPGNEYPRPMSTLEAPREFPGYRILTYLDSAYPGWRATVDGVRVPILRANDVFKAVIVPPGRHTVRFAFTSRRVYAGIIVSLCALACTVAMLALAMRRLAGPRDSG